MRDELDERLCSRYPRIFADRNGDMKKTAMCWGFECGDGWYEILDALCYSIQSHINSNPHHNIPQVVAEQVKEKYGSLRFYVRGGNDYIRGMIHMTEVLSERTCEQCGAPGRMRGRGWLYVACDQHTQEEHLTDERPTRNPY